MQSRSLLQRLSLRRSPLDYTKVQRLIGSAIRGRRWFAKIKRPGLILDIGCGPNSSAANINLDWWWTPKIDICADITRRLPLPDGHVRAIFTEHCLEHVPLHGGYHALREMYRVLQPGGVLRLIVPDLDIYVAEFAKAKAGQSFAMPYAQHLPGSRWSVDGIITPAQSVNQIMREHGHRFIYDFETLAAMLDRIGFVRIERKTFGEGTAELARLDTPSRAVESLYIEAHRP